MADKDIQQLAHLMRRAGFGATREELDVMAVQGDSCNHRVQRFTKDGASISSFGEAGRGDGQFDLPWGVTCNADGEVFVADWGNDRVQRFSPMGRFIDRYGESGRSDGQFVKPSSVAVDGDGYMYVADWGQRAAAGTESRRRLRSEA